MTFPPLSKSFRKPSLEQLPDPAPSPEPMALEEMGKAKTKVRTGQRRKGRPSTILAGRLTSQRGKKLLGE